MSHYFLCSQDKDSKNYRFLQGVLSVLSLTKKISATKERERAKIPSPHPLFRCALAGSPNFFGATIPFQ